MKNTNLSGGDVVRHVQFLEEATVGYKKDIFLCLRIVVCEDM